jgi:hypothetical protein
MVITLSYSGSNSKELLDTLYALGACCGVLAEQHRLQPQQQQLLQLQRSEFLGRALAIIDAYALTFGSMVDLLLQVCSACCVASRAFAFVRLSLIYHLFNLLAACNLF